jgi:hypothetical protein
MENRTAMRQRGLREYAKKLIQQRHDSRGGKPFREAGVSS